jgi:putative solute:sodium symporter small subunit
MDQQNKVEAHWAETQRLTYIMLGIWAFFGFVIPMLAPILNSVKILGFPLGFYMAAQGSLIVFVVQLFWFSSAQNKIDQKYGMAENQ